MILMEFPGRVPGAFAHLVRAERCSRRSTQWFLSPRTKRLIGAAASRPSRETSTMLRKLMLKAAIVVALGAAALAQPTPAAAAPALGCPIAACAQSCPTDMRSFCENLGCPMYGNCGNFGSCQNPGGGIVYCGGAEPEM